MKLLNPVGRARSLARIVVALVLLAAPGRALAQATDPAAQPLVGAWECKQDDGSLLGLSLDAAGTGRLVEDAITWRADASTLTILDGGETHRYSFRISGAELILAGADLPKPLVFTRKAKKGLGGRTGAPATPTAPAPPLTPAAPAAVTVNALVGTWIAANGEETEFRADGSFVESKSPGGRYSVKGDVLTLTSAQNGQSTALAHRIEGDRLILTIGAAKIELVRKRVVTEPATPGASAVSAILGSWEKDGGITEFRADGTYLESKGPGGKFAILGDKIELTSPQGAKLSFDWRIQGDTLTITMGQFRAEYKRRR